MRTIGFLLKSGLPWSVVEGLDDAEVLAWSVVFGEMNGGSFDWQFGRWKTKT